MTHRLLVRAFPNPPDPNRPAKLQLYCTLVTACFAVQRREGEDYDRLRLRVELLARELGLTIGDRQTLPEMLVEPVRQLLGDG